MKSEKSPLRHGSCSNDEERLFVYYISRIFRAFTLPMQAYTFAIRTAPPVTSAVTSSTTQTDATALEQNGQRVDDKVEQVQARTSSKGAFCGWTEHQNRQACDGAPPQ